MDPRIENRLEQTEAAALRELLAELKEDPHGICGWQPRRREELVRILGKALGASQRFEWERIEDYQHITGIEPLDKALAHADAEGLLQQHLARREAQDGREAVIADLQAIVDNAPPGSPAHDGCASWLARCRAGGSVADL